MKVKLCYWANQVLAGQCSELVAHVLFQDFQSRRLKQIYVCANHGFKVDTMCPVGLHRYKPGNCNYDEAQWDFSANKCSVVQDVEVFASSRYQVLVKTTDGKERAIQGQLYQDGTNTVHIRNLKSDMETVVTNAVLPGQLYISGGGQWQNVSQGSIQYNAPAPGWNDNSIVIERKMPYGRIDGV